MQALAQVCVPLCLFANMMPRQEWMDSFFWDVKSYISLVLPSSMKLNLTLVSVIYVAWYLGRPRIETQMMFLAVLFCCQLQSSRLVIITKEANGYLGSRSIKELSEYMMNYVIFGTG